MELTKAGSVEYTNAFKPIVGVRSMADFFGYTRVHFQTKFIPLMKEWGYCYYYRRGSHLWLWTTPYLMNEFIHKYALHDQSLIKDLKVIRNKHSKK